MSRAHKRHVVAVATLKSNIDVPGEAIDVSIIKGPCEPVRPTYSMFVLLTSKIAIVPLFKLLLLWSHGTWRISVSSTASFTLDVTLELWLGPFPPSRPKENYKASMFYLAETIALAFIGACRGTCYRPKIAKKSTWAAISLSTVPRTPW